MTERHMGTVRRKRNLYAVLAGFTAAVVLIGAFLWGASAALDKQTAQANSQVLAQDIQAICEADGKLLVGDRDICPKADSVLANPAEAIPGPKGDPGKDGADGADGLNGEPGLQGLPGRDGVTGPSGPPGVGGPPGADGLNGVAGLNGAPGSPGADGMDGTDGTPGPIGPQGDPGPAGADGQTPTSFTFTDKTGTTYTCTPNPPGSSTYTCSAEGVLP